ncbi:MAG TPA: (2Fe-2S)-binding protein [Clostridium sp.]|nr:(2Fe-2S)-binding protein [Clostridia bacterium]HCW04244.1 (2Fe-2S)-binding protein [Clostridium sp.]
MEQNINSEIMDKLTKVCLCKAIPRSKIKAAIRNGAHSLSEVQKATGAGSGGCKGRRCSPKIEGLIEDYKKGEWQ